MTTPAAVWNVLYQNKYTRTSAGLRPVATAFPDAGTTDEREARRRFGAAQCPALLVASVPSVQLMGFAGWVVSRSPFTKPRDEAAIIVFQRSSRGLVYAPSDPRRDVGSTRRRKVAARPAAADEAPPRADEVADAMRSRSGSLSMEESVLLALYVACARSDQDVIDREVVALVCEELDSAKFSMRSAPGRLDTNRVYSKLARALAAGRVENPARRLYRLTSEGRALVARLGRSPTA